MSINVSSPLENLPNEILLKIADSFSLEDVNKISRTGKFGQVWADTVFDFFAKEILCKGQTIEERKGDLSKLYRDVSRNFIRSLNEDIDKIKDRTFIKGMLTVAYGHASYTPFFLINFASNMLSLVPGYEDIANQYEKIVTLEGGWERQSMLNYYYPPNTERTGIIAAGSTGITIRQTPSNSLGNGISIKLVEVLKKSSQIVFNKLYNICKIPDLDIETSLPDMKKFKKYKNKYALVIHEKDKKKLGSCHCIILWMLKETKLLDKVDFLNYNTLTGVYGEKEDVQKFVAILFAQQFPDMPPSIEDLRKSWIIYQPSL